MHNQTVVQKGVHGWRAATSYPLQDAWELEIVTMKRSGGELVTTATVAKVESTGNGWQSRTHRMFQDFSKRVQATRPGRVTSKVVELQHMNVLADIEDIKAQALAHYNGKIE